MRRVFWLADVAQLVEHVIGNDEVTGSIPVVGSIGVWGYDTKSLFILIKIKIKYIESTLEI